MYLIFTGLCLSVFSSNPFKFRQFSTSEGICDPYIYAIAQSNQGFLYLGTGEGLCRYDGFRFVTQPISDSVANVLVSALFQDSSGHLWVGYNDGTIASLVSGKPKLIMPSESFAGKIVGFAELKKVVYAINQTGMVAAINADGTVNYSSVEMEGGMVSAVAQSGHQLMLGTSSGVFICRAEGSLLKPVDRPESLRYFTIKTIGYSALYNGYLVAAEDEGVFILSFSNSGQAIVNPLSDLAFLSSTDIQSFFEDKEGRLWVASFGQGAYCITRLEGRVAYQQISSANGFETDFVKNFFQDANGNFWVGSYGAGVMQLQDEAFTFVGGGNAYAVATNGIKVFAGGDAKVSVFDNMGALIETIGRGQGVPDEPVTSVYNDGVTLWIGTLSSGVYYRPVSGGALRRLNYSDNSPGNAVADITASATDLWIGTHNGVYKVNKATMAVVNYTTQENLPHNNVQHIYIDGKQQAWISAKGKGLTMINSRGEVMANQLFAAIAEIEFSGVTIDSLGQYWVATLGQGVFCVASDSVYQYNVGNGLKSNYCYGIEFDEHAKVWVGHRQGISSIDARTGAVQTYGSTKGIEGDINQNGVHLSSAGQVWFATTRGLVVYSPTKQKINSNAPQLNLLSLRINDTEYSFDGNEIVLPYDIYKLRFEYIGLDYRAPDEVRYKVMLRGNGFDTDFGELSSETIMQYSNVRDGYYEFQVQAFNNEKVVSAPFIVKIKVKKPFWKTIWFFALVVIILIGAVYLYIKARERKQKALQEFLQRSLDERTREVVEQKEEIELKNRDITDSINYAQRIQASILPSIGKLQDNFSGSFVFYQPRDIVSGDFYWFDRINDRKFVIVCADSTGHGVPGAFMSIIGTTLIKDICLRDQNESPADILIKLDNSLRNTLNQNLEVERSNDGMDIIVCEFDIVTNELRYASAMRPMIIYKNGEEIYVKGSRSSVGGHFSKEEKDFEEGSVQLSKGDIIYMFSDGYTDQFGGPMGKKFKIVRLKNLLKDIYELPMEAQYSHVVNTFELWKQSLSQVDDVLFMGIRV